jgi:vacuolar-type H+-ATPase subunit F/Vma7
MPSVIALGRREFVRTLHLGGTLGRVVAEDTIAAALESVLGDRSVGLVILEAALVSSLPKDLYRRAFYGRAPEVVALGEQSNEVLRSRIRQVAGADLLAPKEST